MIIECVNCKKKFKIDDNLIPSNGRLIQCGSCNHTWFYKPDLSSPDNDLLELNKTEIINDDNILADINSNNIDALNDSSRNKKDLEIVKKKEETQNTRKSNFSLRKILAYFIVLIISFVAIIVVLDTFKSPLSDIFPNLELLLHNLFESIKDIFLFLKNLAF